MAVGLGSTVEELVKALSKVGDVTAAGDNYFTGNNRFAKPILLLDTETFPSQNSLLQVDKNGFSVVAGIGLYQNRVKFNLPTNTTIAKEYTIATDIDLAKKQATLVSGENIKTINGQSILGEGDLEISGGGSGGGSSSDYGGVIISVASTNSYITDPQAQLSEHKIRVRIVSGTLQAGDRLEICRPIAKKCFNRVNGVKTNVRWKQKLKAFAYKIITAEDVANIAAGKNILVLTVNHSSDQPNKGFLYTCTRNNASFRGSAPRTIRITRRTELLNSTQYIQISNSVYVTSNYNSCVIKGM